MEPSVIPPLLDSFKMEPFPHFVLDNYFEQKFFDGLDAEFPQEKIFHALKKNEFSGGRTDLAKGDPLQTEFLAQSPSWSRLFSAFNGQEFLSSVFDALAPQILELGGKVNLKNFRYVEFSDFLQSMSLPSRLARRVARETGLRALGRNLNGCIRSDEFYGLFNLGLSRAGYYVPPHTDNRYKLIVFVVYFDDFQESGGELVLWKRKTSKPLGACERYPHPEALEEVVRIQPKSNRCVAFLNANNAYHSTVPWSDGRTRRMLYAGFAKRHCESMWKTDSFALGDTDDLHRNSILGRKADFGTSVFQSVARPFLSLRLNS